MVSNSRQNLILWMTSQTVDNHHYFIAQWTVGLTTILWTGELHAADLQINVLDSKQLFANSFLPCYS